MCLTYSLDAVEQFPYRLIKGDLVAKCVWKWGALDAADSGDGRLQKVHRRKNELILLFTIGQTGWTGI